MLNEPYPSEGISRMLDEINTLEPQVWLEKYALFSEFEEMMQATICIEYLKRSIPPLLMALRQMPDQVDALAAKEGEETQRLSEAEKKERAAAMAKDKYERAKALAQVEAERLKEIATLAKVSHQDMLLFEKQIRKRLMDQRYCFCLVTKGRKERNYYDLQETPDSLRYITVQECGNQECKARVADGAQLHPCTRCEKAAYCNRKCQKADWKFHRKFCASLASKKEFAVTATTGPQLATAKAEPTIEDLSDTEEDKGAVAQ